MRFLTLAGTVLLCACVEKDNAEIDGLDEEIDTAGDLEGVDTATPTGDDTDGPGADDTGDSPGGDDTGGETPVGGDDTGDGPGGDDTGDGPGGADDTGDGPGGGPDDTGLPPDDTGTTKPVDEICNGIDDDGDGYIDEDPIDGLIYFEDTDGDGFGDEDSVVIACEEPEGFSDDDSDCDDDDDTVYPDGEEVCDSVDNDCDGLVDEDTDSDGDGLGDCFEDEDCDAVDNDGDGVIDEDCEDDCIDYEEDEDCLTWWEAHALGVLIVETDSDGVVTVTNTGDIEVCFDEQALYSSPDTQAMFPDVAPIEDDVRIEAGTSMNLYYGSYTTENGTSEYYLGEYAWWCWEAGQSTYADAVFDYYGEIPPDPLLYFANDATDEDGDKVEDHVDWADSTGVQTQHNVWDYQDSQLILTVGKIASVDGDQVTITITSRNIGIEDGEGTITDVVPAGWTIVDISETPATESEESDGSVTMTFDVSLEGYTDPSSSGDTVVLDTHTITYVLERDINVDKVYQRFDESTIAYDDGVDSFESRSLPTAAFDVDVDGDDSITCKE